VSYPVGVHGNEDDVCPFFVSIFLSREELGGVVSVSFIVAGKLETLRVSIDLKQQNDKVKFVREGNRKRITEGKEYEGKK
jgi:hypothetical protein